jgi:lipoprotein signal peptidase
MPNLNGTHTLRWFAIAATVLLLDQLTKLWIMTEKASWILLLVRQLSRERTTSPARFICG